MDPNDEIAELEYEIALLRKKLHEKESKLIQLKGQCQVALDFFVDVEEPSTSGSSVSSSSQPQEIVRKVVKLPSWAITRYSRQIILPEIGVSGQAKLCVSKVLVVGVGGLGCPAAMYLAGAGVGQIGLVDYDTVDLTNLHRQVLHLERDQDISKVESAADKLRSINSNIKVVTYNVQLNSKNAEEIANGYHLVLDCTDNIPSRYLLNDLCVFLKIPLISGSALKMDGQLSIYGYKAPLTRDSTVIYQYRGPCYRCVFPKPPPPETIGSCSAQGVAGPVPGIIGTLQALEAIKYLTDISNEKLLVGRLLIFDGEDMTVRITSLRPRNSKCAVCSKKPTIRALGDYEAFCKTSAREQELELDILPEKRRITATYLNRMLTDNLSKNGPPIVIDVRSEGEFRMCRIEGSLSSPKEKFGQVQMEKVSKLLKSRNNEIVFICRRGNDSQVVVRQLLDGVDRMYHDRLYDVIGGLHQWAKQVDPDFPIY